MATIAADWNAGANLDVHVLRGQTSRRLDEILVLFQDTSPPVFASATPRPADVVSVEFSPGFLHGAATADNIEAHRVRVNVKTGQVTALTTPALTEVDNFIIDALVTVTRPGGQVTFPAAKIRVHVHGQVTDAWLAPSLLSIREGADGQSFSVLARFDDDTVGDLTTQPGIVWTGGNAAVSVDRTTGRLTAAGVSAPVSVTAGLPADLGGASRSAQVEVLPAWSALPDDIRTATLIDGPGPTATDQAPNILILGDGFVLADRPVFVQLAHRFVDMLRTNRFTSPFDLLSNSINYWWAFIPSPEAGLTVLHELFHVRYASGPMGDEVPRPSPPDPAAIATFTLAELVHEVGLPLAADATRSNASLLTHWTFVFGVDPNRVNPSLIDRWRGLHNRQLLVNEQNTALGLANGSRPQVSREEPLRVLTFHPRRTTREHLDQFLATLIDEFTGADVGRHWNSHPTPPLSVGKDRDRVVVLCAGAPRGGGASHNASDENLTDLIAVGLPLDHMVRLQPVGATPLMESLPHPIPRRPGGQPDVLAETLGVVVHELAHGIGLGEEYGNRIDDLTDPQLNDIRRGINVQPRVDLGAGPLSAEAVRWRWPRLQLAAALTAGPSPQGGGNFLVPLTPRHIGQFLAPDRVRLRQQLPLGLVSEELEVRAVDRAANTVLVHDPTGRLLTTFFLFGAGSVLCVPVPAPPSAQIAGDLFAELMAQRVRERINSTQGPLNAPFSAPARPCAPNPDPGVLQPGTNWPGGTAPKPPRYSAWIVGLYEGGEHQACAVLHPAGACLMRSTSVPALPGPPGTVPTIGGQLYRFCLVCQYILVDRIDAAQHSALEAKILKDQLYPQPA